MKKVFIHIGAHKSASTTIQVNLSANSSILLEDYGVEYIGPSLIQSSDIGRHFKDLACGNLVDNDSYAKSLEAAKECFIDTANEILSDNILISWEGFLGHSGLDKYQGIYPHSNKVSESIEYIFGEFNPRILLIIRRQDDFIESCYLQQIKECRSLSFSEFVDKIDINCLSWLDVYNSFNKYFENSITVFPFELIREIGTSNYIQHCMSNLLGFDLKVDNFVIHECLNPSFSEYGVNMSLELLPKINESTRAELNKILFRQLSSNKYGKAKYFNQFERKLIKDKCFQSNYDIFTKLNKEGIDTSYYLE